MPPRWRWFFLLVLFLALSGAVGQNATPAINGTSVADLKDSREVLLGITGGAVAAALVVFAAVASSGQLGHQNSVIV